MQELQSTSKNISELANEVTSTVGRVDRALAAIERLEPAEVVVSVAGKVSHSIGTSLSSLYAGLKEGIHTFRHSKGEEPKEE